MKPLIISAFLGLVTLAWPLVPADAQMSFSPAAPPVTSSGFNRSSSAPLPVRPVQPATAVDGVPGGYITAPPSLSTEPIDPDHKLNRGDQLSFRVQEDRDDKIWPLTVTDSGEVQLPLPGCRVRAVGKSTRQLTSDIKSLLEHEYYYHATVDLGLTAVAARASRGRVYVTGAVKSVGSVELPLDQPLTASEAIYQMGGPVDFSNLKKARVIRKGPSGASDIILPVNVKAVEDGKLDQDVVLQPGDKVIVPEAKFGIKF